MEVFKLLENVKSFNEYVSLTQKVVKSVDLKLQMFSNFNNTTMGVALKKAGLHELQYFKTYNECGATIILINWLLQTPASREWSQIGKELTDLIQYLLVNWKTDLAFDNKDWWTFLTIIIKITKGLCEKDTFIVNLMLQKVGEGLLELATASQPSLEQRLAIIQCFNVICLQASQLVRKSLTDRFDTYFTRLALWLASCGDVCAQYAALETLLRWTVERQQRAARAAAAERWFVAARYPPAAVQVFVENEWFHFGSTARYFLNELNASSDVVSVLCRMFLAGNVPITSGSREQWLDLNVATRRLTLMLDHASRRTLRLTRPRTTSCDALVVGEDNAELARMYTAPHGLLLWFKVLDPLRMCGAQVLAGCCEVNIQIGNKQHADKLDLALRAIYANKYQRMPVTAPFPVLDCRGSQRIIDYTSEEETRFSNPPQVIPQEQSELNVTASSTSTTSLLAVQEIAGNISNHFDKQHPVLIKEPNLSIISEHSEVEDRENSPKAPCQVTANIDTTNIVDLLEQEALHHSRHEQTGIRDHNSNVIDKTYSTVVPRYRRCDIREYNFKPIVCEATTDESNTTFVENTPVVPAVNKNKLALRRVVKPTHKGNDLGENIFDYNTIENFFNQHCNENENGELIVSPTLAEILNDSSRDELLTFRYPVNTEAIVSTEVVECLNSIIDDVCRDLEQLKEVTKSTVANTKNLKKSTKKRKPQVIKLKFMNTRTKNVPKKNSNSGLVSRKQNNSNIPPEKQSTGHKLSSPTIKRKRKLYSKSDDFVNANKDLYVSETEDDSLLIQREALTRAVTPYKEMERPRRVAATRNLLNTKNRYDSQKKLDQDILFDRVIKTIDNPDVVLADKKDMDRGAVYNFSSDEDGEFKKKPVPRKTAKKSRTVKSKTTAKTKVDRMRTTRSASKKTVTKSAMSPVTDMIDERIREGPTEPLNTSFSSRQNVPVVTSDDKPGHKRPRMETIGDDSQPVKKTNREKTNKKGKPNVSRTNSSKTDSPLRALQVETVRKVVELDRSIEIIEKMDEGLDMLDLIENPPEEVDGTANISRISINTPVTEIDRSISSIDRSPYKTLVVLDRLDIHDFPYQSDKDSGRRTHSSNSHTKSDIYAKQCGTFSRTEMQPAVVCTKLSKQEIDKYLARKKISDKRTSLTSPHSREIRKKANRKTLISPISLDLDVRKSVTLEKELEEDCLTSERNLTRHELLKYGVTSEKNSFSGLISSKGKSVDRVLRSERNLNRHELRKYVVTSEQNSFSALNSSKGKSVDRVLRSETNLNRHELRKYGVTSEQNSFSAQNSSKGRSVDRVLRSTATKRQHDDIHTASSDDVSPKSRVESWLNDNHPRHSEYAALKEIVSPNFKKLDTILRNQIMNKVLMKMREDIKTDFNKLKLSIQQRTRQKEVEIYEIFAELNKSNQEDMNNLCKKIDTKITRVLCMENEKMADLITMKETILNDLQQAGFP
ncbi:uncharacterized protein LOC112055993 [Bicyclus anynana]|uniref:Uncharacterized protein LOC112055993 n=1 Tax=Bicyclus anynana TaxID=110368 RepID=A0ABM3LQ00_BICAN|nr:uncharacterized protein LOC112055993 [Bicyclus anynana]